MKPVACLILLAAIGCGATDHDTDDGGSTRLCTLVGCRSQVTMRSATLAVTEEQIQDSRLAQRQRL